MSSELSLPADGSEAAFGRAEFAARMDNARAALRAQNIDLLIVTGPENIFYLTGQQTPGYYTFQALLLPAEGEPDFIVRQLELLNCRKNSFLELFEVYQDGDLPADVLGRVLDRRSLRGRRVAIEKKGWFLPVALYEQMAASLGPILDGLGVVERLRMVKSAAEIAAIDRAGGYADAGLRAGMAAVAAGKSENDLVAAMMAASIAAGSEYVGMEPLVSSGPRGGRTPRGGGGAWPPATASSSKWPAAMTAITPR